MKWKGLLQITKYKDIVSKTNIESLNPIKTKAVGKPSCQTKRDVIPIILIHLLHASGITAVTEEMGNQYQAWLFIIAKKHNRITMISDTVPSVPLPGIGFLQKLAPKNEHLQRKCTYINCTQRVSLHINAEPHSTGLQVTFGRFSFPIGQIF